MRCGRGCELFLNGSSKQVRSLLSPFWDGQWTVRDCTQCISGAVLHFLLCWGSIRTTDNAWICDLLDNISISSLACVLYLVPCAGAHTRPLLTHTPREGKARRAYVRTVIQDGQGPAQVGCRPQGLGPGNWGKEAREAGAEGGGPPGTGNWERRPAWAKTKDVDRQRVLSALQAGLQALRPSGPQGPLFSVLSGPLPAPWPVLINCLGLVRLTATASPTEPQSTSYTHERYVLAACIMIGRRRTPMPTHTTHALHDGKRLQLQSAAGQSQDRARETFSTPACTQTPIRRVRQRVLPGCLCSGALASLSSCQSVNLPVSLIKSGQPVSS